MRSPGYTTVFLVAAVAFIAAAGGQAKAQTFAVVGDYGEASTQAAAVATMVKGWNPDFIVTTGDNTYGALTDAGWSANTGVHYGEYMLGDTTGGTNRYTEQTSSTQRFFPSPGNHDTDGTSGSAAGYLNYFHNETSGSGRLPTGTGAHSSTGTYYDFVVGDAHFWAVDSDHPATYAAQKAWLQNGMAASTSMFNFVFFHHPAYSSSSSHGSTPGMQWDFQGWGATAVFAGHDHVYERIILTDDDHDAFPYFTTGNGGRSLYSFGTPVDGSEVRYNANYGAMLVTLDQDFAVYESWSITDGGIVIDRYTTVVPEPASMSLLSAGVFMVLRRRRRRMGGLQ